MNHPRIACYSANSGSGRPLVKPDGSLDVPLIEKVARFPEQTWDITPWWSPYQPARTDALLLIRKLNPKVQIYFYHVLGWFWLGADFTSQRKTFADAFHDEVKAAGAFLPNGNVSVARAEAGLTELFCGAASSRLANGIFFDFCSANDYESDGAIARLIHAVRQAGGPGFKVLGNGWTTDAADGAFREGRQTFEAVRDWRSGRPHITDDWLQQGTGMTSLNTPEAQRWARFTLGMACLFDCMASFGPDRNLKVSPYYGTWWMPEYDGGGIGCGWLGEPSGPAWMVGEGSILWLWRREFAGGTVLANPTSGPLSAPLPKGLCRFDGLEVGSVTVPAQDAVFLVRAR